ncbi:hypothetical protein ESY86_18030 [Subsaximicrobium wynnwilliamsii]|uniref:DUF4062 domain-containing protein n=1 Tax=Subsaximicrobium wynnwilliamsii TaxID=291179 RepID=A0A5C6ZC96_9FLAO|nr:DUF4062 domain-containing protein [Subsaximicrobium wynnwilliamsii]TXD81411.1 hypothetical protein ESY87_18245 [Subsaximicrobium wynnwilliamsii]TXD87127.1 hypothetical protein ESY86_18030 [Subsaximicrobium wynnwilliamsii]TXE00681.1 hypothetical protein ESY88_18700 [Subsaximicrobium wynnwilliamsii]
MKTIRIFIASSSELKDDRDQFRKFISMENDRLHTKGVYLEIVQWENFLDAISDTRLQDEYNNAISNCDIVLCLFFTKVGKYSSEEFDTAYQVFKDKGKPKIWTYFKDAQINTGSITDEINTLLAFKKKIGSLGHFYTKYTNIDNLINQYRSQLDKYLPAFETNFGAQKELPHNADAPQPAEKPIENTFNDVLTKSLIQAIKPYDRKANDFLSTYADWEKNKDLVPTVKRIIISGYVGVLGMQLRKLMSIGEEDFSDYKMKRYLENCHLTALRALQLICYALISSLWDNHLKNKLKLSNDQNSVLIKFFKNATDESIKGLTALSKTLITVFLDNQLEFPIAELKDFLPKLQAGNDLSTACADLNTVAELLDGTSYTLVDCANAEKNLAILLESLNFLVAYKMISIKDIDYSFQRNDKEGFYLHHYTLLDGDSQASTNKYGKIRKDSTPVTSYAVLLFKDNYQKNINLVPFVIDYNGLADAGGSKICFYSFCNTFDDMNLNYNFIEDNSKVTIKKSGNMKPDDTDVRAINNWLSDKENRKDMNFDNVFDLFYKAKKALVGIEEDTEMDEF